jgi:hypothetical protein
MTLAARREGGRLRREETVWLPSVTGLVVAQHVRAAVGPTDLGVPTGARPPGDGGRCGGRCV